MFVDMSEFSEEETAWNPMVEDPPEEPTAVASLPQPPMTISASDDSSESYSPLAESVADAQFPMPAYEGARVRERCLMVRNAPAAREVLLCDCGVDLTRQPSECVAAQGPRSSSQQQQSAAVRNSQLLQQVRRHEQQQRQRERQWHEESVQQQHHWQGWHRWRQRQSIITNEDEYVTGIEESDEERWWLQPVEADLYIGHGQSPLVHRPEPEPEPTCT